MAKLLWTEVYPLGIVVLVLKKQRGKAPKVETWVRSKCGTFYLKVPPHNLEAMKLHEQKVITDPLGARKPWSDIAE
jgi:hypothetical protein